MKNVYLTSDHVGIILRRYIYNHLGNSYTVNKNYKVLDLGPTTQMGSVDYPDYAEKLAMKIKDNPDSFGIALCGSGVGMSIALNRYPWIRAALVHNVEMAKLAREHGDANCIVFGEKFISVADSYICVHSFLHTDFSGEERHIRRIEKMDE